MLGQVNVIYEQKNINDKIFPDGWNYINDSYGRWVLEDSNSEFYYIPVEGNSKLIIKKGFKIIDIPCAELSAAGFQGNNFQYGNLIQIWSNLIVITNLFSYKTSRINWENKGYIVAVEMIAKGIIRVDYYDMEGVKGKIMLLQ